MFDNFRKFFSLVVNIDTYNTFDVSEKLKSVRGYKEFMTEFSGKTICGGLYRIQDTNGICKWNEIIGECFPTFKGYFTCFAYDWLGRHFALDYTRKTEEGYLVLMFDFEINKVYEIPCNFIEFHEVEIPDYTEECLEFEKYGHWNKTKGREIEQNECVGFKIPLILGGEDKIENMEIIDMEVYLSICNQLHTSI